MVLRGTAAVILRLAGVLAFIPLAFLALVFTDLPAMIWAGLRAIVKGPDEAATDTILLNPVANWANDLPLQLFLLAARVQPKERKRP